MPEANPRRRMQGPCLTVEASPAMLSVAPTAPQGERNFLDQGVESFRIPPATKGQVLNQAVEKIALPPRAVTFGIVL